MQNFRGDVLEKLVYMRHLSGHAFTLCRDGAERPHPEIHGR